MGRGILSCKRSRLRPRGPVYEKVTVRSKLEFRPDRFRVVLTLLIVIYLLRMPGEHTLYT